MGPKTQQIRRVTLQISLASTGRGRCRTPGASCRPELSFVFPPSSAGTHPQQGLLERSGAQPSVVSSFATSPGLRGGDPRQIHGLTALRRGGDRDVTKSFFSGCSFRTRRGLGSCTWPESMRYNARAWLSRSQPFGPDPGHLAERPAVTGGRGQPLPGSCTLSLPGDTAKLKDLLRQAGAAGVPSCPAERAQPEGNAHRHLPPATSEGAPGPGTSGRRWPPPEKPDE